MSLTGCSGFQGVSFPNVATQSAVGTINGSVFGGHAPIVASHVFLLEANSSGTASTGYATKAKSLLSSSSTATSTTYPVSLDSTSGSVTNGLYYVTTDALGAFNITGDYTCDAGQPVYLYSSGGSPNASAPLSITGISVASASGTYTYTFTAANSLAAGRYVQIPVGGLGGEWATLNGTTQTVVSPTSTSLQIATTIAPGTGTNTQTGTASGVGPINPAIVNLAMLGVCPSSGNFSTGATALQYVYMNEVSTVAMGYAMAGFSSDALHIGSSASNVAGLANAALNAANLYDIQGRGPQTTTTGDGEGHLANLTTAGGGTVPQAELDTLGNVLAACVDSANTATSPSATCNTLFASATSDGTTTGTKPLETATAVINIAHNPGAANVVALYTLPGGTVPFTPSLGATAPHDFTVAISYTSTAPTAVDFDVSGNAYIVSNGGAVSEFSAAGANTKTNPASTNVNYVSVAVDPSGSLWALSSVNGSNKSGLYNYTISSTPIALSGTCTKCASGSFKAPSFMAIDNTGIIHTADSAANQNDILGFNTSGVVTSTITSKTYLSNVTQFAFTMPASPSSPPASLWVLPCTSASDVCLITNQATPTLLGDSSNVSPLALAVDSSGNAWVSSNNADLYKVSANGTVSTYTGGGVSGGSPAIAVDGSNNIWVANSGNSGEISEFTNAGAAISGSTGYTKGLIPTPSAITVDASGTVWVLDQQAGTFFQLVGAAAPTVKPMSAVMPGVKP